MKWMISLMAMALAGAASAQELDCDNAMTTVEMTGCAALAYEAADADLNAAYGLAMERARQMDEGMGWTPTNAELLRDAQRAWIPFRDAACTAESTLFRGGTAQNMLYLSCLEGLTRQRTEQLRFFGEEG